MADTTFTLELPAPLAEILAQMTPTDQALVQQGFTAALWEHLPVILDGIAQVKKQASAPPAVPTEGA